MTGMTAQETTWWAMSFEELYEHARSKNFGKTGKEGRKAGAALAMQRSYQLLKDSKGKLPSKSISALAKWLAAWDVLKSPREEKWWLGDGIDLVNRAKAMGYEGPSMKMTLSYGYVLLQKTPRLRLLRLQSLHLTKKSPVKRKAGDAVQSISKRPAKGQGGLMGGIHSSLSDYEPQSPYTISIFADKAHGGKKVK